MANRPDNDNLPLAAQGAGNGQANGNDGLRFLSVCSGIEAASVAWPHWHAVGFAEIDKKASELLAYRYPHVRNYGDFTSIPTNALGRVDILCGGTPCQAFSVAGARRGLEDARGNLSLAFVGLAHVLADGNGLRNAIWENVPGVLTMADNAFGCFLAGLVGADGAFVPVEPKPRDGKSTRWWRWSKKDRCHAVRWPSYGMVSGPKGRAAWAVKDAQFFGLAQRRERVIVVGDFGNGADPAAVLLIEPGVPRDPPSRGKAGEGVAGTIAGGARTGGEWPAELASTLNAAFGSKLGLENQHINSGAPLFVPQAVCVTGTVTHTLTTEGADASEDGTGRGTPIIAFTAKDYGADAQVDLAPTLRAGTHKDSHANGGVGPAIAFQTRGSNIDLGQDVTGTLSQNCDRASGGAPCVAQTVALRGREGGGTAELGGEVATALRASSGGGDKPHVLTSAVRRLTPRECERLQGFPDDYTRIPVRRYPKPRITKNRPADMWELIDGEWWLMTADGPRYKQLGNSWAVPKFRWLGERIQRFMPVPKQQALAA